MILIVRTDFNTILYKKKAGSDECVTAHLIERCGWIKDRIKFLGHGVKDNFSRFDAAE
jgi:hypothetical protein